tara:strand:+ start:1116 stop:1316 length:201 start_codon:yes stop_codon:yes gene_type:complete
MESLALALLISEHNTYHWQMSCQEWNNQRVEILSNPNHTPDAQEYLIDYFRTKVEGECDTYIIGRK